MNTDSKIEAISKMYGSYIFRGRNLKSMQPSQIGAIYQKLLLSGKFDEYEKEKRTYISLFPNAKMEASKRASKLSIFELRKVIPEILRSRDDVKPIGYQYTVFDIISEKQGKEQEKNGYND